MRTRWLSIPTVLLLLSLPALAAMPRQGFSGGGGSPCESVARLAKKACQSDARDDFLTFRANCLYVADPREAAECKGEAEETLEEDLELCEERFGARLDVCDLLDEDLYDPGIEPAGFVSPEEMAADPNPYFPLVAGNTWVYEDEEESITVVVTDETLEIEGVPCVVVRDVVTLKENGERIEDTEDYYAQDVDGNLWYFGEIAQNFEEGRLADLDGSWEAGVDFAKPGILIPRHPFPGQAYRQEYLLREAEDLAQVVSVGADESVPGFACENDCLQTLEFTPVEPDAAEFKFYLPGVGLIAEVDPETGARLELVSFTSAE